MAVFTAESTAEADLFPPTYLRFKKRSEVQKGNVRHLSIIESVMSLDITAQAWEKTRIQGSKEEIGVREYG